MLLIRSKGRNHLAMVGMLTFVLLASFGCATQNWVIDTVREMDKPLVDRVAKIEATAAAEKIRVDGQLAEIRATAAAEKIRVDAQAAAEKIRVDGQLNEIRASAQLANQKADAEAARLTRVLANRLKRTKVSQVDVLFKTGMDELSPDDMNALQGVVKQLADNPTYTADVVGFTDKRGTPGYNVNLSWQREEAVRRFMIEKGADLNRFFFIGLGEDLATGTTPAAEAKDRRGAVTVYSPAD